MLGYIKGTVNFVIPGHCVLLEKTLESVLKRALVFGWKGEGEDGEDFIFVGVPLTLETRDAIIELPIKLPGDDGGLIGSHLPVASWDRCFLL